MFDRLKGKFMGKHRNNIEDNTRLNSIKGDTHVHYTHTHNPPRLREPYRQVDKHDTLRDEHDLVDWAHVASRRFDIFAKPKISPQGQDGTAHFNYFDAARLLSFQWDGDYSQDVVVSHGGHGEPVLWTFEFLKYYNLHRNWILRTSDLTWQSMNARPVLRDNFADAAGHFKNVCDFWIEYMEDSHEDA